MIHFFTLHIKKKITSPSTERNVVVVDTPSGLNALNTISPVSSGYVSVITKEKVPSFISSTWNSRDDLISKPSLYHLADGLGLPLTWTSNLNIS